MEVTVFKNIWDVKNPMYIDVLDALKRIRDGSSKALITKIRKEKDPDKQQELKKGLPSFMFCGKFSQRGAQYLLDHSGLICLDIDKIKDEDMDAVGQLIVDSVHTFAAFISPRGNGFKVLIKVPPDRANHKGVFRALEKHFNKELQKKSLFSASTDYKIDESGKDISRVCYESYDPDMYYNEESEIWAEIFAEEIVENSVTDQQKILDILRVWIDRKEAYIEGNRNRYLHKFMYACCRFGVQEHTTRNYLESQFPGLPPADLKTMLTSCYKAEDFGSQHFTEQQLQNATTYVEISIPEQISEFWKVSERGKVKINTRKLLNFIEAKGFGIYRQKDDVKTWDFILIKNMIVDIVDVMDIKKDVLNYVMKHAPGEVFDELQMKNRYFEKTFLNAMNEVDVEQIKDKGDKSYMFFEGFYYEITAKEIKKCDYIDLDGFHIWRSQLCKQTITKVVDYEKHHFNQFVINAMGSPEKYVSACTCIGYGIHTYKKQRLAKLVYCCDASDSELDGLMSGGSGKNLYQKVLSYARSVIEIDGKEFNNKNDKFRFQTVRDDTQIIIIDDYEGDIKELFPKITGGFSVERKALHKKVVSFEDSPKLFVSSNMAPKGFSDSYARRIHILEFSKHYNKDHTPSDDFGDKDFFSDDWNQDDYNALYSFIFQCTQEYLKHGIKKLEYKDLHQKQLILNVGRDFAEYWTADNAPKLNDWTGGRKLREDYCLEMQVSMNDQTFYGKMRKLCKIHGWHYETKSVGVDRKIMVAK